MTMMRRIGLVRKTPPGVPKDQGLEMRLRWDQTGGYIAIGCALSVAFWVAFNWILDWRGRSSPYWIYGQKWLVDTFSSEVVSLLLTLQVGLVALSVLERFGRSYPAREVNSATPRRLVGGFLAVSTVLLTFESAGLAILFALDLWGVLPWGLEGEGFALLIRAGASGIGAAIVLIKPVELMGEESARRLWKRLPSLRGGLDEKVAKEFPGRKTAPRGAELVDDLKKYAMLLGESCREATPGGRRAVVARLVLPGLIVAILGLLGGLVAKVLLMGLWGGRIDHFVEVILWLMRVVYVAGVCYSLVGLSMNVCWAFRSEYLYSKNDRRRAGAILGGAFYSVLGLVAWLALAAIPMNVAYAMTGGGSPSCLPVISAGLVFAWAIFCTAVNCGYVLRQARASSERMMADFVYYQAEMTDVGRK